MKADYLGTRLVWGLAISDLLPSPFAVNQDFLTTQNAQRVVAANPALAFVLLGIQY